MKPAISWGEEKLPVQKKSSKKQKILGREGFNLSGFLRTREGMVSADFGRELAQMARQEENLRQSERVVKKGRATAKLKRWGIDEPYHLRG